MNIIKEPGADKDLEICLTDDPSCKVPDKEFEAAFIRYSIKRYYNQKKLYVWYSITEFGEYNGLEIYKAYNYYTPPKRNSDFVKDCEIVLNRRLNKKERISVKSIFANKILIIKTRTVKRDRSQIELKEFHQYSVIDKIVGVKV